MSDWAMGHVDEAESLLRKLHARRDDPYGTDDFSVGVLALMALAHAQLALFGGPT